MNKIVEKKSEFPQDWDYDEMLNEYGNDYLIENEYYDDEIFTLEDDGEIIQGNNDLYWVACRICYGGKWLPNGGFTNKESFDPQDEYFVINGYGNWYSLSKYYLTDYLKTVIDEEEFYDYCVENGYFESEEDE